MNRPWHSETLLKFRESTALNTRHEFKRPVIVRIPEEYSFQRLNHVRPAQDFWMSHGQDDMDAAIRLAPTVAQAVSSMYRYREIDHIADMRWDGGAEWT